MKVLLITDNHNPRGGGTEKYFFLLLGELRKNKDLEVFSLGFSDKAESSPHCLVIKESSSLFFRHFWRLFFNLRKYSQIKGYILKTNPDIIHLHNINKYTLSLLKAVKGRRVVQTVHDVGYACPNLMLSYADTLERCSGGIGLKCFRHKCIRNFLIYLSLRYFHLVRNRLVKSTIQRFIAPSLALKKVLESRHFENVTSLPNFVETPKRHPSFDRMKRGRLLYVGQLEKNKGVAFLLKEFSIAIEKDRRLTLDIAGTGSQEHYLKNLAQQLGIGKNVNFLGWVSDVDRLYQESVCLILPSLCFENAPMVILEAMSRGRMILGANRGGIPWFIDHGRTGFVFEPLKKGELAGIIVKTAGDLNLCRKMGKAAFLRFSKIEQKEVHIRKILKIYEDVCATSIGRGNSIGRD